MPGTSRLSSNSKTSRLFRSTGLLVYCLVMVVATPLQAQTSDHADLQAATPAVLSRNWPAQLALPLAALAPSEKVERADPTSPISPDPAGAPASSASDGPPVGTEAFVSVRINGRVVAEFTKVYRASERRYLVKREVLTAARIPVPATPAQVVNNEEYFDLDQMAHFTFDVPQQSLSADIPTEKFQRSVLDASFRKHYDLYQSSPGFLLNHEVEMDRVGGANLFSGLLEPRFFSSLGVFSSQLAVTNYAQSGPVRRLQTTFVRDMPDRMTTLTIGDSVTRPDVWGRSVNFAGVRWSRNFGSRPDFIPYLLPSLDGQAAEPSTIDLYVNNARLMQKSVDAGPFSVANIPIATGTGDIRLVVTDVFGRQQVVNASYLASPILLRRGVSDFDYSAGVLRWGYGGIADTYHTMFVAGTHRYGLSSSITLNLRGELVGTTQAFGSGLDFKVRSFGILSVGSAGSHSIKGLGGLVYGQLQHQSRTWGYSANVQSATSTFRQVGFNTKSAGDRLRMSASLSRNLNRIMSAGFGYVKISRFASQVTDPNAEFSGTTGSAGFRLGKLGFLNASVLYAPNLPQKVSANFTWSLPIGRRRNVIASSQMNAKGASGFVETGQYVSSGTGYGYRARTSLDHKEVDAGFDYQNAYGNYTVEMGNNTGGTNYRLRERSGILFMNREPVATRWQYDSFALVDAEGNRDVPVLSNNQEIMKTDHRGLAVVPLVRYDRNMIRLDDSGLPVELSMDLSERSVVPRAGSGVLVHFAVEKNHGLIVVLRQSDGKPVPAGAEIRLEGSDSAYVAGYDGEVYFENIVLPSVLHAAWQGGSCSATVPRHESQEPLPRLGPIACGVSQ